MHRSPPQRADPILRRSIDFRMKHTPALLVRAGSLAALLGTVALFVAWSSDRVPKAHAFHSDEEMEAFERGVGLSTSSNHYFRGSGLCSGCHGHDPSGFAMTTQEGGEDVNVVDDWRSTMMANAAKDPFWRAKVSHEVLVNPAHQSELEDKCTSCHAPMGRQDKFLTGMGHYSIGELEADPLAQEGVSCVPCHIQSADSIGLHFSGNLKFDTLNRPLYGPYGYPDDPTPLFGAPMASFVGYEPQYGAHIHDAGLCAGCHTLQTATADLNGDLTGNIFTEQATYHEWLNSKFNNKEHAETGVTCQGCHVPSFSDDGVVISANYLFLQPRTPFGLHQFAGANTFMLRMLKEHIGELQLFANVTQFDSTISRTERMLRSGLVLEASMAGRTVDTAFIDVKLQNAAGHKFPSGYPARRAWVELVITDAQGDTLFHNGGWDQTYEIVGHDALWEPHHDLITGPDEVQIYEMVMADVNGDKTTTLERAASKLKDNRLVPELFTAQHYTYDTSYVANVPAADIDFNHDELGVEGSGSDIVHYHVPMNGYDGLVNIQARVWYQSAPPKWMEEMFGYSSDEIDAFRDMYDAADNTPFLVKETSFTDMSMAVDDVRELGVHLVYDQSNGMLSVIGLDERVLGVDVFDATGRLLASRGPSNDPRWQLHLPTAVATYHVVMRTAQRTLVQRFVVRP